MADLTGNPGLKYLLEISAPTDLLRGAINGSRVEYNSSLSQCDRILSKELTDNLYKVQNITQDQILNLRTGYNPLVQVNNGFDLALVLTRISSQLHPIALECSMGAKQVYSHFYNLIIDVNGYNVKPYVLNLFYNFGHMYDSAIDIYFFWS